MTRSTVYGYDAKGKQKFAIPVEVTAVEHALGDARVGTERDRFRWEPVNPKDRRRVLALLGKGGQIKIDLEQAHGAERDAAESMLRKAWSEGWAEFLEEEGGWAGAVAGARADELARRSVPSTQQQLDALLAQRERWTDQAPCPTCDCNDHVDAADGMARTGCTIPKDVQVARLRALAAHEPDPVEAERCTAGKGCRCWGGRDRECEGCWLRYK